MTGLVHSPDCRCINCLEELVLSACGGQIEPGWIIPTEADPHPQTPDGQIIWMNLGRSKTKEKF